MPERQPTPSLEGYSCTKGFLYSSIVCLLFGLIKGAF